MTAATVDRLADAPRESLTYRLIITRRNATEVLLLPSGPRWALPRVEVRPHRRLAEELTSRATRACNIEAYCLLAPAGRVSDATGTANCAVLEATKHNDRSPTGAYWMARTIATTGCEPQESDAIAAALEELDRYRSGAKAGPFAKPGWLRELFGWAQQQLDPIGLRLTGSVRQFNASPSFSLMRLDAGERGVWFKATGEPNSHELPITVALARLFPRYVPRVLGVWQDWNGWLSEEPEGCSLDGIGEFIAWKQTAKELAEFQIASIGKECELLAARSKDLRCGALDGRIEPFLAHMAELMAAQEKPAPAPLSPSEMEMLGEALHEACALLDRCCLPDTVGNIDFNPGNIIVSRNGCTFLDWAEGCVANPLLTFEYLRQHMSRSGVQEAAAGGRLLSSYLRPWKSLCSTEDLRRAAALSPLVAVFAYGVANDWSQSVDGPSDPAIAAFYRSLTRRMYREAVEMAQRRESCLR